MTVSDKSLKDELMASLKDHLDGMLLNNPQRYAHDHVCNACIGMGITVAAQYLEATVGLTQEEAGEWYKRVAQKFSDTIYDEVTLATSPNRN